MCEKRLNEKEKKRDGERLRKNEGTYKHGKGKRSRERGQWRPHSIEEVGIEVVIIARVIITVTAVRCHF